MGLGPKEGENIPYNLLGGLSSINYHASGWLLQDGKLGIEHARVKESVMPRSNPFPQKRQ